MKRMLGFVLLLVAAQVFAIVPQQLNYEGYLADPSGSPLDTTVAVTFKLYSDSLAGSLLWTEARPGIVVQSGLFNVRLGQMTALTDVILNQTQLWLGITVGGNAEMTPRSRIVSTGYSYRVGTVDGASGGALTSDVVITGRLNVGQTNTNGGTNSAVFGRNNSVSGDYSNASGYGNSVTGDYSTVGGGLNNTGSGAYATVSGGTQNSTGNPWAAICGGDSNRANGIRSFVGGGEGNYITNGGTHAVLGGGMFNQLSGIYGVIGGGFRNVANDSGAAVLSGVRNYATGPYSVICGGGYFDDPFVADSNVASEYFTAVVGGYSNRATGYASFVGGGTNNRAASGNAAVCAGGGNNASSNYAFVGGGGGNTATESYSVVCGGFSNSAGGPFDGNAFVGGGHDNEANGDYSVVAGGDQNTASGWKSAVAGGSNNTASGSYTFAVGQNATAAGDNSITLGTNVSCSADSAFAWSDGSGPLFSIGSDNTFNLKANGGYRFWTTANHADNFGARLPAGGSAWTTISDSTKKRNLRDVNTKSMLDKVNALPIKQWSYKSQDSAIEHIGPMAQDFWKEFHLGDDSLSISTIDPSGIALAAIQELAKHVNALERENQELRTQMQTIMAEQKQSQR